MKKYLPSVILTLVFLTGLSLACASYEVDKLMGHLTIEQILFHLNVPMEGISPTFAKRTPWFILRMLLATAVFYAYCEGYLNPLLCRLSGGRLKPQNSRQRRHGALIAACTLLVCATVYANYNHNIIEFLQNVREPSTMINEAFVDPRHDSFTFPEKPRNLVIIIAESLEQTFSNHQLFGQNLIHELSDLQQHETSFSGLVSVNGANNTIASTSAILYGIPRLLIGLEGEYNELSDNIFKYQLSILSILHRHGYQIGHIQGGSLRFAATDSLFSDIPNADLTGLHELSDDPDYQKLLADGTAYDWGINDRIVLAHARRKLTAFAQQNAPFCLTVSTLDSHYDGYLEPSVKNVFNDYRDIIREQSRMLAHFIEWIQKQPFGPNTTIVILGDHFVMKHDIADVTLGTLSNGTSVLPPPNELPERTVFNCFINTLMPLAIRKKRLCASFDIAPTILQAIGVSWNSAPFFSLGTSLYADQPTLLERVSGPVYERESSRKSTIYMRMLKKDRQRHPTLNGSPDTPPRQS